MWSRLELVGEYVMDSDFRIGDGTPDGLALESLGNPVLPASTVRGALRATLESLLQNSSRMDTVLLNITGENGRPTPSIRRVALACDPHTKEGDDLMYQGCLTPAIISAWERDPLVQPKLDHWVNVCTCRVCRLFGTTWLAGRITLGELRYITGSWDGTYTERGGMGISRDTGVLVGEGVYRRRAISSGVRFEFRLILDNADFIEQGIMLLGIRAFEMGWVSLGGDRSRGLGLGHLELDWWASRYVDTETVSLALLSREALPFTETDADQRIAAAAEWLKGE